MLHIFNNPKLGHTVGKNVCSRLVLGKCVATLRGAFFVRSLWAHFFTEEGFMGWRYRKSINVGLGFRINISKSGIGYSWGGPGYRKTWKADGGTRTTYSIPGTGISYVEETRSQRTQNGKLPRANSMERYNLENSQTYSVVNGKIDALSTPENKLFIEKIKSIKLKNFFTWLVGLTVIFIWSCFHEIIPENIWTPILLALSCLVVGFAIFINSRRFLLVEYSIDNDIAPIIDRRNNALSLLCSCSKVWNIEQYEQVAYSRVNAGAGTNVKRGRVYFSFAKAPGYLKIVNDIKVYQLSIGGTRYIFLPDKILVVGFFQVGALRYHDISVSLEYTQFVETEIAPSDATFLYNTWQYVNNNGTPDRRFNNNKQIPVYAYEKIFLRSATGLNLHLMVSSTYKAERFKENWDNIKDIL